jgi:nicotinate-nucleotide adenylyltransferase
MKKIAIFGTSADPPTIAHKKILLWLAQKFDLVAVYAVDNPFKQHSASFEQRNQMLFLLIEDIKTNRNNILVCPEISDLRSLNTINKAREKWGKEVEFSLVIGSDLTAQIQQWYKKEELLGKVKLLIIPRPGYPLNNNDLKKIEEMEGSYQIAQANLPPVSSTKYRKEGHENILTETVKTYIKEQKLY